MKKTLYCVFFALGIYATGCTKQEVAPPAPAPAPPQYDPVASIKAILQKPTSADKIHDMAWRKLSYDVKRTDSLVSPYVADVSVTAYAYFGKEDPGMRYEFQLTLINQDNRWILKRAIMTSSIAIGDGEWHVAEQDKELDSDDTDWKIIVRDFGL